jgi:adenylosuccinate synthase
MNITAILGCQWGDEGKGKIVDLLGSYVDVVCRFQGGNNAGHTIVYNNQEFKLRLIPSGIFTPKIKNILGSGVMLSPSGLCQEIDQLQKSNISFNNFYISDQISILLDIHKYLDKIRENKLAIQNNAIGTTFSGIGPAYEDKIARRGIKLYDFKNEKSIVLKLKDIIDYHNSIIKNYFHEKTISIHEEIDSIMKYSLLLMKYSINTFSFIKDMIKKNKNILLEGAQGALLDIDHGTYPYVTSSTTTIGAINTLGINQKNITDTIGITKAYSTRVGNGPFPTEIKNNDQDIADIFIKYGKEFGSVTNRQRRCGWLDLVLLKYTTHINGITALALTKLDILSYFTNINICIGYTLGKNTINIDNFNIYDLHKYKPIYKIFEGWNCSINHCTLYEQLPLLAKEFIFYIESQLNIPIIIISVGKSREQTIFRKKLFDKIELTI